ncbi:N4-(beta-N-acetylglucosaminyl)-L-asparaginase [Pustulibacterium marinum]|uniref:N4-(Beta-N-acetylglucosaminyl)-L-asparaginase n=1 Tax=Pustulibacterium marinum TaxID=1224947 RepID=A0A1I7G504_9FLAO|nr:N(4)-(beta-N-acetylglucosaminyl)-L-asparaginase [Pustulibacterium marinum]SFU43306.1 N4-(beta-N-acetylglucosaminyl)-L-asparaginase [Pustulibacterium marinum]
MINRRKFIGKAALGTIAVGSTSLLACETSAQPTEKTTKSTNKKVTKPSIISTWNHGLAANEEALKILEKGGYSLDAVEQGVRITEADPKVSSVGYGGWPDREGNVTLDACIMDHNSRAGSVAFLQNIMHPISVARKVMEETPHVMLVGAGAKQFALEKGFKEQDLLTDDAKKAYKEWLEKSEYKPVINIENHDTISMIAMDEEGRLSAACTTSGAAWKIHGRVGDSPIIGSGLFLDSDVGAAAATGLGEAIIRTSGSAMVVELMRQGRSPQEACKEIVERIYEKHRNQPEFDYLQVGFIAMNKYGETGGYCLRKGFNYATFDKENGNKLTDAEFKI